MLTQEDYWMIQELHPTIAGGYPRHDPHNPVWRCHASNHGAKKRHAKGVVHVPVSFPSLSLPFSPCHRSPMTPSIIA